MKPGAGDDMYDDLEEMDRDEDNDEPEAAEKTEVSVEADVERERGVSSQSIPAADDQAEIPYLLRRTRVKENRETVGFGLQKPTRQLEDEVLQEVKSDLDVEKLPTMDLREAAYLVGLQHPDLVAEILLKWGYEHRQ